MNFKRLFFITVSLLSSFGLHAQSDSALVYQDLNEAIASSKEMIFVNVDAEWCKPCKAMEDYVLNQKNVQEMLTKNTAVVKINSSSEEGKKLTSAFKIDRYPAYLFLTKNKELIHKVYGYRSANNFINEIQIAHKKQEKFVPIEILTQNYKTGQKDAAFIYTYLNRKHMETGLQPDLLNEYIDLVPESEYHTEKILQAIADNINSVETKSFEILTNALDKFPNLTDSQQKLVLSGITQAKKGTFEEAVRTKSPEKLEKLINAIHATAYSINTAMMEERQFRYDYAKHTQDFNQFKVIADFETPELMRLSPEDYAQKTQENIQAFKQIAIEKGLSENSPEYKALYAGASAGAAKLASYQLNDFARGYWQMTDERNELLIALKWSAYAVKLEGSPANWETYAYLLKKLGRVSEAKKAMKRSLKQAKWQGLDTKKAKAKFKSLPEN